MATEMKDMIIQTNYILHMEKKNIFTQVLNRVSAILFVSFSSFALTIFCSFY